MEKPLTQLPFDFSESVETELKMEELIPVKKYAAPVPPVANRIKELEKAAEPAKTEKSVSTRGRRSLKEFGVEADLIQIPDDETLFQKQYYSIGEVAVWFRVNQSLLRYWESEFDILQPRKNRKGDRFFRPMDVKNLQLIYDLLRRRKFTIEGAKDYLKKNKKGEEKFTMIQTLERIKAFLNELKASL